MNEYYTKQEYEAMQKTLTKRCKALEKKVEFLTAKIKKLKNDYDTLLDTATE